MVDLATGNDDPGGDEGINSVTHSRVLFTVHELSRWQGTIDHRHRRPLAVVQVEHGVD